LKKIAGAVENETNIYGAAYFPTRKIQLFDITEVFLDEIHKIKSY
tara:strand:- start:1186 stop:1320 length:135 start_codon:yes stop_codon:yes gene_type:complete